MKHKKKIGVDVLIARPVQDGISVGVGRVMGIAVIAEFKARDWEHLLFLERHAEHVREAPKITHAVSEGAVEIVGVVSVLFGKYKTKLRSPLNPPVWPKP